HLAAGAGRRRQAREPERAPIELSYPDDVVELLLSRRERSDELREIHDTAASDADHRIGVRGARMPYRRLEIGDRRLAFRRLPDVDADAGSPDVPRDRVGVRADRSRSQNERRTQPLRGECVGHEPSDAGPERELAHLRQADRVSWHPRTLQAWHVESGIWHGAAPRTCIERNSIHRPNVRRSGGVTPLREPAPSTSFRDRWTRATTVGRTERDFSFRLRARAEVTSSGGSLLRKRPSADERELACIEPGAILVDDRDRSVVPCYESCGFPMRGVAVAASATSSRSTRSAIVAYERFCSTKRRPFSPIRRATSGQLISLTI